MLTPVLLIALLSAGPDLAALRRELDAVATRIEELKARGQAGESVEAELTPLLVRSQELADEIERARPHPPPAVQPAAADPARELVDELRETAGELREEAHRLAAQIAELDAQIAEARWRGPGAEPTASRVDAQAPAPQAAAHVAGAGRRPELEELLELRRGLAASVRVLQVEAATLEAAADALERRGAPE